jgi:AAA ATPase domain
MPPLLEREPPLAALVAYAREAARGSGRLVLVSGEAGVDKSALVEQLQADLRGIGARADTGSKADTRADVRARWFWGMCDGLSVPRPLGPLFDIARGLGGELAELCRARAPREELFAALLGQVDVPGTLSVVVIEDMHWADEGTVDLLRFLGRRLRDASTLLIATYRDDGLPPAHPLRLALGELATQRSARRIELAPLSADAVRILATGSGLDAGELHRLTGGNPFYVTEVIRAGTHQVPASARDAVLARAGRLSPESREVLEVAALIGPRVEWRLLEAASGRLPAVVDDLLASGLLLDEGRWLRFRHELARLAMEQSITARRRGLLHARILSVLQSLGLDDDAALAFHAEGAADGPAVLRHAPAAARRASELGSHREAAAQFERALRFVEDEDAVASLFGERHGAGYGVELGYGGYALIEKNDFAANRHSISGDGRPGTGYLAYRNLFESPGSAAPSPGSPTTSTWWTCTEQVARATSAGRPGSTRTSPTTPSRQTRRPRSSCAAPRRSTSAWSTTPSPRPSPAISRTRPRGAWT